MRLLLTVTFVLTLSACQRDRDEVRPDPPPEIIEVPVPHYVPVPDELTAKCSWIRNAPLQDILPVARGRRHCLEVYEANIDAIRRIQGGAVAEDED